MRRDKLDFFGQVFLAKLFWVGLKSDVAFHDQHALARVRDAPDLCREGKTVKQLRAQVAFFGVHRAHQDEARRVSERDPLALDHIHPHRSRVKQQVNHVVIQQVDLVNIQQPAVGGRQHAGLKMALTLLNGGFDIQRTHHAVLGGADRQVNEGDAALDHLQLGTSAPCAPWPSRTRSAGLAGHR